MELVPSEKRLSRLFIISSVDNNVLKREQKPAALMTELGFQFYSALQQIFETRMSILHQRRVICG